MRYKDVLKKMLKKRMLEKKKQMNCELTSQNVLLTAWQQFAQLQYSLLMRRMSLGLIL